MKLPEGFRLREGDLVRLNAIVRFDQRDDEDGEVHVKLDDATWVHGRVPVAKVEFIRRNWKPEDYVANAIDRSKRGEVIAAQDGMAWVKLESGAFVTFAGADLLPALRPGATPFADELPPAAPPSKPQPATKEPA